MSVSNLMLSCIEAANEWSKARTQHAFGADSPEARKMKRRFRLNAVAEMTGISRQAITKAEDSGRLPAPELADTNGTNVKPVRLGYTLEQINNIREVFGAMPSRPPESDAVTLTITGGKGGCYKTATTVHFAQWLAMKGYRVLVIDIDPQSHLSMYFGYHPELHVDESDTILPFMLGNEDDLTYCVKNTAWPQLDIIPSNLQMQRLERELPHADIDYAAHSMLQAGISTISDCYDVILVDGHPDLGMGTMNMICASDIALIATSTEVNDINSTSQLMMLIHDIYSTESGLITTHEPLVRVLPTKIGAHTSSSVANLKDISEFWGEMVLKNGIRITDEVGKGQRRMATIYEQADSAELRSSPAAWKRAIDLFDAPFNEILNDLIKPVWGVK